MNSFLDNFDKAFENKIRLGTMAALVINTELEFTYLRDLLRVTDGNLATHLRVLEENGYIFFRKEFILRKPRTFYSITPLGRSAFEKHLTAIESLLNK